MPLNKVKPGNMYKHVTHTHNHLAGSCPHACTYCSTQDMARRFPVMANRYSGPPWLIEKELLIDYGKPWASKWPPFRRYQKTIFVENCSDLFARGIDQLIISAILEHCCAYPGNTYVFQTKNPERVRVYLPHFPPRFIIGTTAESNFDEPDQTKAPVVLERLEAMRFLDCPPDRRFVTVEPIQSFDLEDFLRILLYADVDTYYIGADSKHHGLEEPTGPEIKALVEGLRAAGKRVVLKSNLKRLYQGD